jgi:hypothetical protein
MRLELEQLDARGFAVHLAPAEDGTEQLLRVRSTTGLKGELSQSDQSLRLSNVGAEWLVLDALALAFGNVWLRIVGEATLGQVRCAFAQGGGHTELDVGSHGLHAQLEIDAGSVRLRGEARMQGTQLQLRDAEGRIEAEVARVENFRLQVGELVLSAPELSADELVVGWGEGGFKLEAKRLSGVALSLTVGALKLSGEGLELDRLSVRGANVSFASARVEQASLSAVFGRDGADESARDTVPHAPAELRSPAKKRKLFDYALLDGLSGTLHIDAVVDMTVPIIGNRRATHKLRLQVDDGSIDFRELESDLSALEGQILDFSVRDDALVLERGIPLLPTRGFGKPLLLWDLDADDVALAHKRLIRLSVLPRVRLARELQAEKEEREGRESSSAWTFALRRLGLENILLQLSLDDVARSMDGAIKQLRFDHLSGRGEIQHEMSGEARPGLLRADLEGLVTKIEDLALGETLALDIGTLSLGKLRDASLTFVGLKPEQLTVSIAQLNMQDTKLRSAG